MEKQQKNQILDKAKRFLDVTQEKIDANLSELKSKERNGITELKKSMGADRIVQEQLFFYNQKRIDELSKLYPSPYFYRCDIIFDDENEVKQYYFAKFPYTEEMIYSWIAPIASVRFNNCGKFSYRKNDGKIKSGKIIRKDQFMINDGKIIFLATELVTEKRTLIHQEHLTDRKTGFVLPEIVEQMEKAQDQVIRANHLGPFVISGPAGSGKTTLALHRVAYLIQSPETTKLYPSNSIIVFVQDNGTKEYFSQLLPDLGIHNVKITTFFEWASTIFDIKDMDFVVRWGENERERNLYEIEKNKIIKNNIYPKFIKNKLLTLDNFYKENLSQEMYKVFMNQKRENVLDKFDLVLLLNSYEKMNGELDIEKEYYVKKKDNSLIRKNKKVKIEYSLIIVDEFQNYLPEQLKIIKKCVEKSKKSVLYVGDLGQQIYRGTIKTWSEIGEEIEDQRKAVLSKVYRNTKEILGYIKRLGYEITVPKELKSGQEVVEEYFKNKKEEVQFVKDEIGEDENKVIGILGNEYSDIDIYKEIFKDYKNIQVLTMAESQGVEFENVFIVGLGQDIFKTKGVKGLDIDIAEEYKKIQKDLLYVALTRAMNGLYILRCD